MSKAEAGLWVGYVNSGTTFMTFGNSLNINHLGPSWQTKGEQLDEARALA